MLSGDWIPVSLPDRIRSLAPHAEIISLGGATEASIWSICYPIDVVDPTWKSIPYGRPLANQTVYVLGEDLRCCDVGVSGELYIGGQGVAVGYWNRPDLNGERFIPDPFSSQPGAKLYRTGDLGRYLHFGDIEFLGPDRSPSKDSWVPDRTGRNRSGFGATPASGRGRGGCPAKCGGLEIAGRAFRSPVPGGDRQPRAEQFFAAMPARLHDSGSAVHSYRSHAAKR